MYYMGSLILGLPEFHFFFGGGPLSPAYLCMLLWRKGGGQMGGAG